MITTNETIEAVDVEKKPENTIEVIAWCKRHNIEADLVGSWVWVRFEAKPSEAVRNLLKGAGFRWCKNRGEWAHNCGRPSRRGITPPRFTYGAVPVRELNV